MLEVLVREGQRAVDEVPVHGEELAVITLGEVLPLEVRVLGLGHRRDPVVSELVRVEAFQEV